MPLNKETWPYSKIALRPKCRVYNAEKNVAQPEILGMQKEN